MIFLNKCLATQLKISCFPPGGQKLNFRFCKVYGFQNDHAGHTVLCSWWHYLVHTAKYIFNHSKLLDTSILPIISCYIARETLDQNGKWPRSYSCIEGV